MNMSGFHYDLDSMFPKSPDFYAEEELCMKDYEYIKRMYPKEVRLISSVLEEYLDRYEYEGSSLYAQYLDSVTIYKMTDDVLKMLSIKEDCKKQSMRDMIHVMVCQEIYVRRRRHERFCKKFERCNIASGNQKY